MTRWKTVLESTLEELHASRTEADTLREALRLVVDRLRAVHSEEPGEGPVVHVAYVSTAEVKHLKAVLGEAPS